MNTWATVTAVTPLRIRLDGDTVALPFTPDSLVDPALLSVGDRVRVELSRNKAIILGSSGGDVHGRTSFVPSFTGFTLGNGTVAASHALIGPLHVAALTLTFGSTSVLSGDLTVAMPTAVTLGSPLESVTIAKSGVGTWAGVVLFSGNTGVIRAHHANDSVVPLLSGLPFSTNPPGAADQIKAQFVYF